MKRIMVLLALSLLIASCQPRPQVAQEMVNVCKTSCDEIGQLLGLASGSIDDALRIGTTNADEASQLFKQSGGYLDELAGVVRQEVAVHRATPYQLADEILIALNKPRSHLQKLVAWADDNEESIDFFGNLVCAYHDAYRQSWINNSRGPNYEDLHREFIGRNPSASLDITELQVSWNKLNSGLTQNQINMWDSSITFYCTIADISLP